MTDSATSTLQNLDQNKILHILKACRVTHGNTVKACSKNKTAKK